MPTKAKTDRTGVKRYESPRSGRWRRWYSLEIWVKRLRPMQLAKEPLCRECAAKDVVTAATEVDHVKPHRGDWSMFVDSDNHQSLCKPCHSSKTMRENHDEGRMSR